MSQDKAITFSFKVDQRSLEQTKNAIRQLTAEVKILVETMARAGSAMGGLGGGSPRGLFGGASGSKAGSGGGGAQTTIRSGSVLTDGITNDAKGLSIVARAGVDAMKQMTSGVSQSVTGQVREIERLKNSLKDLNVEYQKFSGGPPGGGGSGFGRQDYSSDIARKMVGVRNEIAMNEVAHAKTAGGGGFVGLGQQIVTRGGIDLVVGAGAAASGGFFAGAGMKLLGAGVAVTGGMKAYDAAVRAMTSQEAANVGQQLNERQQTMGRQAAFGQVFGGTSQAIYGGSISSGWALAKAMRDQGLMKSLGMGEARDRALQLKQGYAGGGSSSSLLHFSDDMSALSTVGFGGIMKQAYQRQANNLRYGFDWINGFGNPEIKSTAKQTYDTKDEIAFQVAKRNLSVERVQELSQGAANIKQSDPRFSEMMDRIYGEAGGRVSGGRVGGFGGGTIKKGPYAGYDAQDVMEASLTRQGFSFGEEMGRRRGMGGIAGWGLRGALGGGAGLSAAAGGMTGIENLMGLGEQFGGIGGGGRLYNAAQKGIGSGGMDVTAGSNLYAALAESAKSSGQFGFGMSFQPALEGLASMGVTGSTGGDMMRSKMLAAGMGGWNSQLNGGIDPLQMALNVSAANTSMSGKSWMSKKGVMDLGSTAMLSILRGGEKNMPQELKDLRVGVGDVRAYHLASQRQMFARVVPSSFGADTPAGIAAGGVRGMHGDWISYIRSRRDKLGKSFNLQNELSPLATVLDKTTDFKYQDAMGDLMAQLTGETDFTGALNGHGAHAAGMSKRDKASLEAQAKMKLGEAHAIKENLEDKNGEEGVISAINASPGRREAFDGIGKEGGKDAAAGSTAAFSKAMGTYTAKIGVYTEALTSAIGALKAGPKR